MGVFWKKTMQNPSHWIYKKLSVLTGVYSKFNDLILSLKGHDAHTKLMSVDPAVFIMVLEVNESSEYLKLII